MRQVKMTYVKVYVRGTQREKKIGKGLDADIFLLLFFLLFYIVLVV